MFFVTVQEGPEPAKQMACGMDEHKAKCELKGGRAEGVDPVVIRAALLRVCHLTIVVT